MNHQAPMPDDVSPIQHSLEKAYWTSLLTHCNRPGLGLVATRFNGGLHAARDAEQIGQRTRHKQTGPLTPPAAS